MHGSAPRLLQPAYVEPHIPGGPAGREKAKQDFAELRKDSLSAKFPPKLDPSAA